jgi:monoamine oxidase
VDSYDVVIIGAGAAGLAAAQDLMAAGLHVCCVEARDRIGGRILTLYDAATPLPIELGAEFVHGKPAEIVELARAAGLHIYETGGRPISLMPGGEDMDEDGSRVLEDLSNSATEENDETFQSFLDRSHYSPGEKHAAAAFVEGFNAARREMIGTAALAQDQRAGDTIEGDSAFRIHEGYGALIQALTRGVEVRLNSVVEAVAWKPGSATVRLSAAGSVHARHVVITVPLGVLQAGAIRFDPEPTTTLAAARALRFGDAIRVTFLFESAFWDDSPLTANAGFLFSDAPVFPVWWTGAPAEMHAITGWTAGPKADALIGLSMDEVISRARDTLVHLLKPAVLPAHRSWFHDWYGDPFSRGAYSYVPARALPARRTLAEPVEHTLYFAGEATDLIGYGGTVHGAIASGRRAARQIVGPAPR